MISRAGIVGVFAVLSSCGSPPPPPPPGPVTFMIGNPYEAGGEWNYPRNFNSYDVTGLATVIDASAGPYTADNEPYDGQGFTAQSPVLPLPSIVTVTNLVNGVSMQVRVNDRGPMVPGRVLAVSPTVAQRLGFPDQGPVEVEVALDVQDSASLQAALGQGPKLTAAPVASISAQSLGPPGGSGGAVQTLSQGPSAAPVAAVAPLSGAIFQGAPSPGPLWVQIPGFGREFDAYRMMERLYGIPAKIVPTYDGSRVLYAVNAGPYSSPADADAALQAILARGVADPAIIVR
jgi:rare lipoprotein A